jgi:hypothetical protein
MWVNKEGMSSSTKSIASRIRQVLLNMAKLTALDKHVTEQIRLVDLMGPSP